MNKEKHNHDDLIVVGGGITGLCIAYLAAREGQKVTLIEGGKRIGGLLATFPICDTHLEKFYHHFFVQDEALMWLLEDLGIHHKLKFSKTSMGLYYNGQLYDFGKPSDLLRFSPLNLFDSIRYLASGYFLGKFANWSKNENVSALSWLKKHAGYKSTRIIWEPMFRNKFGTLADSIPLAWLIGRLRQRMQSRKRGNENLGYLEGSLKTLLDSLQERLKSLGVSIITESQNHRLENLRLKTMR